MNPAFPPCRRLVFGTLLAVATLVVSGTAHAFGAGVNEFACGSVGVGSGYGPFDYRTVSSEIRHRVEDYHFTPKVEASIDGNTGTFGGDVDYTLRAFPNNPRALLSISRWSLNHRTERVPGARWTTECYFERARRFQPNDPMPYVIYAAYLRDRKRMAEVRPQLDEAERLRGDQSGFDFDYNLGLLYFDVGAYEEAQTAAKRAYALGAPMPGLQKKLQAAGKWRNDPVPPAAPVEAGKADPEAKGDVKTDAAASPAER